MELRGRDAANLIIGALSAALLTILLLWVLDWWRALHDIRLPLLAVVTGMAGFLCAVFAEYIRRWKGLAMSLGALIFFLLWFALGDNEGGTRLFVVLAMAVTTLLLLLFALPQIIVNLGADLSLRRQRGAWPYSRSKRRQTGDQV